MEKYAIEGTPKTPTISFDIQAGVLEIKGRSIPENSIEFYKPMIDALDKYSSASNFLNISKIHFDELVLKYSN